MVGVVRREANEEHGHARGKKTPLWFHCIPLVYISQNPYGQVMLAVDRAYTRHLIGFQAGPVVWSVDEMQPSKRKEGIGPSRQPAVLALNSLGPHSLPSLTMSGKVVVLDILSK